MTDFAKHPVPAPSDGSKLLSVKDLSVAFDTPAGLVRAVEGVSFDVGVGEVLCLVGESGSGKSVTAKAVMQLVAKPGRITGGTIDFTRPDGTNVDIARLDPRGAPMRSLRGAEIAMIFQEPSASLSQVHTVGDQVGEVLRLHHGLTRRQARAGAIEALATVGIPNPAENVDRYPFQYSGGMRQRVMIATAIACKPRLIIADEPTTALDVTTQADILDLLMELRAKMGMGLLFITHDLGVVAEIADRVVVMRNGSAIEAGPVAQVLSAPSQPYTRALVSAVRRMEAPAAGKIAPDPSAATALRGQQVLVTFPTPTKRNPAPKAALRAVDGVDIDVRRGEAFGIVGESGSGKTTLARALLKIIEPAGGDIAYHAPSGGMIDVRKAHGDALKRYRQMSRYIFQDPYASLNPRMNVGQIIAEPLRSFGIVPPDGVNAYVRDLLEKVGLPREVAGRYPHAFSGGQRQRIGIARALACSPDLIVADEATSALDVSLRAQILDLMIELQSRLGLTYIFITHDIGVVRYFCDRVAVMQKGKVVEVGDTAQVCNAPSHPYTKSLLASVPSSDPAALSARGMERRSRFAGVATRSA